MSRDKRIQIIVADASPIIRAGLTACLRRVPGFLVTPLEVSTMPDLADSIDSVRPDIIFVSPTFGGVFDPQQLRSDKLPDLKIAVIEAGPLDKQTRALYDDHISVIDDMPAIGALLTRLTSDSASADEEKDALSQREKEIVTYVVKGFTNKEIADKLYLSIHTVITHRRNIARKLEIHSATGLTIYAIMNHLVDLSEIKV